MNPTKEDLLKVMSEYKTKFENCLDSGIDLESSVFEYVDQINKLIGSSTIVKRRRFPLNRSSFEYQLLEEIKPLFDKFPNLYRLRLAHWGRFYKYELAGESYYDYFDEINYSHHGFSGIDYRVEEEQVNEIMDEIIKTLKSGDYWTVCNITHERLIKIYDFDDRGGATLEVYKDDDGTLRIDFDDEADSNE